MKTFIIIVLFIIVIAQANSQTIYSNQYGQPIGSSTTIKGTTYYSNQYGQPLGTSRPPPTLTPTPPPAPPPTAPTVPPMMPIMPIMPILPVIR
jgi:hypothetical protein